MGLQQHSSASSVFPAPQVRLGHWTVSRFDIKVGGTFVGTGVMPVPNSHVHFPVLAL